LRSRKASTEVVTTRGSTKSKGKGKQVEFSEDVKIREPEPIALGDESDLTDLAELEENIVTSGSPSPRRLRSRDKRSDIGDQDPDITPKQRERGRRQTSKEEEADNIIDDEDEVDELLSSPSPTPSPVRGRPTPIKRRLRPRRIQTHTPPSDGGEGDDEEEAEEDEVVNNAEENEDVSIMGDEESEESEDSRDLDGDDDAYVDEGTGPVPTTPRKLRNGKVVGEECQEETSGEDEGQDDDETVDLEAEDIDIDAERDDEDAEGDDEDAEEVDEAVDGDDCWFISSGFLRC